MISSEKPSHFQCMNCNSNTASLHHSIDEITKMILENNEGAAIEIFDSSILQSCLLDNRSESNLDSLRIHLITMESLIAHALIQSGSNAFIFSDARSPLLNRMINAKGNSQLLQAGKCIIKTYCKLLNQTEFQYQSNDVKRAIQYIKCNFGKKILIADICRIVNLSKNHICELFKKETGISINSYIRRTRVNHSKYLLQYTTLPLLDIALDAGFESQSYFTRVFKSETGVTPKQYRRYSRCF